MLTKFGVAVLIFGDMHPQNRYKNNRFCQEGRHDSRINVAFGTEEGTEDPVRLPNFTFLWDILGISDPKKHEKLPKIDKITNLFADK